MANETTAQTEQTTNQTQTQTTAETQQQQPRYMTADEYNAASTARERRLEARIAKLLDERLSAAARVNQTADAQADEVDTEAGDHVATAPQETAQPKRLSGAELAAKKAAAKVDAMAKQLAAEKEAAAKEKAELLQRQERSEMIAALTAAGVTTAKGAYAVLREDGRIRRNAEGELVMVLQRDAAGTKYEEEVTIAAGLKEWLATDEGKHYMPPRGGGEGSGTTIRGGASRKGAPLSKEEAKHEAAKMLSDFVLGGR